ncbi:MAG: phage holin family protein [Patescibacteria group bacterium]
MTAIILRIIANSLALYLATLLVPSFLVSGGIKEYALAGLVLALLNMLVRPLLKLVSLPFIIITFGLFTVIINAFMIWLVDVSFDFVSIETFMALFWTTMIVSAVNILTAHTT